MPLRLAHRLCSVVSRAPLAALALFAAGPTFAGPAAESELWREYIRSPDTHRWIPNCSYAGYQYGEKPLPRIEGPVFDVKAYGAVGDGSADDTAAVRAAIAAAGEAGGGVVLFPDGRYAVAGVLFVHSDRTVLRGQSRDGARIVFTQPLNRGHGRLDVGTPKGETITRWSYSGGLVWFSPLARGNTYRDAAPDSPLRPGEFAESWLTAGEVGSVAMVGERGDRSLTLDREPDLAPGDFVLLRQTDPGDYSLMKHLSGDGPWAEAYPWTNGKRGSAWPKPGPLQWVVEVESVQGRSVTFRQPLRFEVRPQWKPTLLKVGPLLRESGIEDLTLEFQRRVTWNEANDHHHEEAWNGPYFNNAVHCWLRNVTMIDVDNGPNLSAAKNITLTDFSLKASRPELMVHHHGTLTRASSHDNLFTDFRIESQPWHGANIESLSTGNVWRRGVLAHGTFDSHRRLPFENIRTDITLVTNDGTHGGNGGPLMGARFAHWNMRTPNGRNYIVGWANALPQGVIVGLQGSSPRWDAQADRLPVGELSGCRIESLDTTPNPPDLYAAQLALRLGATAPASP